MQSNKRLILVLAAALALLLIPFVAMRFTNEVVWTALDFITMGVLLICTGLGIEFALRIFRGGWVKVAAVAAVVVGFVVVWGTLVHMGG